MNELEILVYNWRNTRTDILNDPRPNVELYKNLGEAESKLAIYAGKNLNPNNKWVTV